MRKAPSGGYLVNGNIILSNIKKIAIIEIVYHYINVAYCSATVFT